MEARDRDLLRRMPLSEAVLVLFRWMAAPELLDDLFERLRGRCYEKVLSFTVLVQLVHDALMLYHGSGRQSFERAAESDELSPRILRADTQRVARSSTLQPTARSRWHSRAFDSRSRARQEQPRTLSKQSRTKRNSGLGGGGETPRPPLEQSGSRPDGGGGRHRPAASPWTYAAAMPIHVPQSIEQLVPTLELLHFSYEMQVSFLKYFNVVTTP